MAGGPSRRRDDWKVFLTLDREAIREEIRRLQSLVEKPWHEIWCIVDAEDEQDAKLTAKEFKSLAGLRPEFVKGARAHRLPC